MKYFTRINRERQVEEISKETARSFLERAYEKEIVDDIFNNNRMFRLDTFTRVIWTDGLSEPYNFNGSRFGVVVDGKKRRF